MIPTSGSRSSKWRIARAPIDHFLRTLAETHDGTAIGVILTGGGSDGSIGLRRIRECGGLAIAQDPQEAEFDSMPRSAISRGVVDLVLPLRRISKEILSFCATHPRLPAPDAIDALDPRDEMHLRHIVTELCRKTEHDFNMYTSAILLRRLRRRMQLRHVVTLAQYRQLLEQDPQEAQRLANDLLLLPSEFFRDHGSFQELEQRVIPSILAHKTNGRERLRVWTIGCSTGEEAYSVAMLPRKLPSRAIFRNSTPRPLGRRALCACECSDRCNEHGSSLFLAGRAVRSHSGRRAHARSDATRSRSAAPEADRSAAHGPWGTVSMLELRTDGRAGRTWLAQCHSAPGASSFYRARPRRVR